MTAPTVDQLISRKKAAEKLGIHVNTLDKAVRDAGIQRYRMLGDPRVFFRKEDVETIDLIQPVKEA